MDAQQAKIELVNLRLRYSAKGGTQPDDASTLAVDLRGSSTAPPIRILPAQFTVLLGPSGCGKSSLLRMIAGLVAPTEGEVLKDGRRVTGPGSDRGLVFQSYTCFPWLTVRENVLFGRGLRPKKDRGTAGELGCEFEERAGQVIQLVGLGDALGKYPRELSGGMMQRVAIARALVNRPDVILMDEPFGALDPHIRVKMQELILEVERTLGTTIIFVTHDAREAVFLGDVIYISTLRPCFLKYRLVHPFQKAEVPRERARSKYSGDFLKFQREVEEKMNYLIENPQHPRVFEEANSTAFRRSTLGVMEELSDQGK
jgi:ABC-type nitrate/sulfonate/bicarbonate transport system ATPase subunit